MNKITRFVIWICSRFDRARIEDIVKQLQEILANRNPEVKPRDDFKKNIRTTETSMYILIHPLPNHPFPKQIFYLLTGAIYFKSIELNITECCNRLNIVALR